MIPRLSSSASTSSGILPFTRTAYIPRTYFAEQNISNVTNDWEDFVIRTCSLPPCHPARFRINDCDDAVEMCGCAGLYSISIAFHLQKWNNYKRGRHMYIEFGELTCMSSSQFGQPCFRKSRGVCIIEQSKQARRAFARG